MAEEIVWREFTLLDANLGRFERNKEKIIDSLKVLTDLYKQEETRNYFCHIFVCTVQKYVNIFCHPCCKYLDVSVELLRLARNLVAGSRKNQDLLLTCPSVVIDILGFSEALVQDLETSFHDRDEKMLALRCCVQFCANLVAGNDSSKNFVWDLLTTQWFLRMSLVGDDRLTGFAFTLLRNCLAGCSQRAEALVAHCPDSVPLVSALLKAVRKGHAEWALYALEDLIRSESFATACYAKLESRLRVDVLDIVLEAPSAPPGGALAFETVSYLADVFVASSPYYSEGDSPDLVKVTEAAKTLEVLCASCSYGDLLLPRIQELPGLLLCCANLLRGLLMAERDRGRRSESAAFGFKRDLVRLLGNMCWKHRANQDRIRDWDCIPALLDCCRLDTDNPFITQWAIFAIRNLCEDNEENRSLIGSLEKPRGALIPPEQPPCVSPRGTQSSSSSRAEVAREDVADLFL